MEREEAFSRAVEAYGQELLRYCHHILCDYQEAQDAVQTAFLKAWERWDRAPAGEGLRPWLYRVCYTGCMDILRRRKRGQNAFREPPREPTELADPVDEAAADGEGEDSEAAYQPSQAEIDAAMEAAHAQAQESESKVKTLGELKEGSTQMEAMYMLRDWLFDEARAEGDTTVIEDSTNHRYYVLEFKRRYLDQSPSVDLRILAASREEAQSIMDEWKQGEATEESFAVIYDKYNTIMTAPKGGLYEGLTSSSGLPQEITDWFLDSSRKEGDAEVFAPEGLELSYVCYYVGLNEPSWFLGIKTTLTDQSLDEYMHERLDSVEIQDPKGNLKYLQEPEEESTEGSDAESAGSGESTEGSDAESTEPQESTEGSDAESTEP